MIHIIPLSYRMTTSVLIHKCYNLHTDAKTISKVKTTGKKKKRCEVEVWQPHNLRPFSSLPKPFFHERSHSIFEFFIYTITESCDTNFHSQVVHKSWVLSVSSAIYIEKIAKNHLWEDMIILKGRGYPVTKINILFCRKWGFKYFSFYNFFKKNKTIFS